MHIRFVHLLLLTAERPWAHAMHMKSVHAEDNASKGITGSTRRHIISRLSKALGYAQELVSLLQDQTATGASDTDLLEAHAYAKCLAGAEEFEKQTAHHHEDPNVQRAAWQKCLMYFSEAHIIYTALLRSSNRDVYKEVLASTVDPSIRYAAYQSRLPRTVAISTVAKQQFRKSQSDLLASIEKVDPGALSDEKSATSTSKDGTPTAFIPTTITWRGRTAPIVDASIGQALAATSFASAQLSSFLSTASNTNPKSLAVAYDPVLTSAQDAVDATRTALSELSKEGISESDPRMQDLRVSDLSTAYALISWRIGRNRVLISSPPFTLSATLDDGLHFLPWTPTPPKHPRKDGRQWTSKPESRSHKLARLRARVVLYDATLQSIDSIRDLRGASRDPSFMAELNSQRAYFQALKCLNIGYSHAILARHANALALFARAAELALASSVVHESADVPEPDGTTSVPTLAVSPAQTKTLQVHTQALTNRQHGLVALHHFAAEAATAAAAAADAEGEEAAPLVERLDEYPASGRVDLSNLVLYPPRLRAVPVKPIFLDLAWNYIDYPGRGGAAAPVEGATGRVNGVGNEWASSKVEEEKKKKGWFGFGR